MIMKIGINLNMNPYTRHTDNTYLFIVEKYMHMVWRFTYLFMIVEKYMVWYLNLSTSYAENIYQLKSILNNIQKK